MYVQDYVEDVCCYPAVVWNVVDDFNREASAIEIGLSLPVLWVTRVSERIATWGYPKKLRRDNDPEFISVTPASRVGDHHIELAFIQPGETNIELIC